MTRRRQGISRKGRPLFAAGRRRICRSRDEANSAAREKTSPVKIAPDKNTLLYDGARFFIFEEKLPVGDTRARHSHNQRLVVNINETKLQQWVDGQPNAVIRDSIADDIHFNEPAVHITKNIGRNPMRNIVIELKP